LPFQRIPGTSTQHGIAAKFSVARVGNSFAYLSRNIRGEGQIMMMNGYTPTRIATHAVENSIEGASIYSDARHGLTLAKATKFMLLVSNP
jgi:hypothetical protein